MESRGKDAWGASDGVEIIKHLGPITESWEVPTHWEKGIFHTRSASHGKGREIANAHPFTFEKEGRTLIGIHNGIVTSHDEMNKKYERDFKVDSQHIFRHMIDGLPLGELTGYMALAWWDLKDGEWTMNFARANTYDLHIATLEGGELVFCSLWQPMSKAAKMMGNKIKTDWKVEEYHHYRMKREGNEDTLVDLGALPFATNRAASVGGSGQASFAGGSSGRGTSGRDWYDVRDDYWKKQEAKDGESCFLCKAQSTKEFMCKVCLSQSIARWKRHLEGAEGVTQVAAQFPIKF
jgi:predicted glutamine amidotransferase